MKSVWMHFALGAVLIAAPPCWTGTVLADDQDEGGQNLAERVEELEAELAARGNDASGSMRTALHGFGHVGFFAERQDFGDPVGELDGNAFANGGLDLFITSRLSDRLSFLNETLFEPTEEGENVLDVERVIFKIRFDDRFNLHLGRVHSSLGYWNTSFHHGEWLQTSIGRPRVLDFEDEDGVLPVHLIGVVLNGRIRGGAGTWSYALEAGNGRGATPDPPQLVTDANEHKAANAALSFEPSALQGLTLGGGIYRDKIPENADGDAGPLHGELSETILSAFCAFENGQWELIAELFDITHDAGDSDASSTGYYVQLGFQHGRVRPYLRMDALEIDDQDTFFTSNDDMMRFAGGIRWDYSSWSALKVQVEQSTVEPASGDPDVDGLALLVQNAFAF